MAAIATFQFYDGYETDYTAAYPVLAAAGVRGMVFIPAQSIDDTNKLTLDELLELQAAGWDVGCYHAVAAQELPSLTAAELYEEVHRKRMMAVRRGLRGADFAGPYQFHAHAREKRAMMNAGFRAIWSNDADGVLSPSSTHTIHTPQITIADLYDWGTQVQPLIDAAVAAGSVVFSCGCHKVVNSPSGIETSPARLAYAIAYVQSLGISISTFSDLVPQAR